MAFTSTFESTKGILNVILILKGILNGNNRIVTSTRARWTHWFSVILIFTDSNGSKLRASLFAKYSCKIILQLVSNI